MRFGSHFSEAKFLLILNDLTRRFNHFITQGVEEVVFGLLNQTKGEEGDRKYDTVHLKVK